MLSKIALLVATLSLALPTFVTRKSVGNDFHLNNMDGNDFALTEQTYENTDSFVYTARAHFDEGQACGLVFGAVQDDHYWVFNVDRYENRTKLIYFYKEAGSLKDIVLKSDYFVGNDKVQESELRFINSELRGCPDFNFKIVITKGNDKMYGEFFIDNIKRFGVDTDIDLNSFENITYQGGALGYNVFKANINFNNITYGKNDFSYYTELYRNQFHYSQYAHWNNDPNGLVYYKGYYHMYYQTNPFSQQWGSMYWGHARSRDLVHWQELPIALFPDDGNMGVGLGVGYAWSGIAMVYHKGMSGEIDSRNYFPNGEGDGLIGFYTRDGAMQDQVVITSDDEGLTWVKRYHIPQNIASRTDYKVDCRDPSIFTLKEKDGKTEIWGMALSGGTQNKIWFLASMDLVTWIYVGEIDYIYAECATVSRVKASDDTYHHVISVSSRDYIIGDFSYNPYTGAFSFNRLIDNFVKMDYGEDSYAAQCFYIDDNTSKYYGKNISISWYSGLPSDAESGVYADVRYPWNGGGMTIPVSLGLTKVNGVYKLTQTPITLDNTDFEKEAILSVSNQTFNNENNPLEPVSSHLLELKADISNPNEEDVEFRVNVSDSEYTAFGWNKTDGYYFDRRNTGDAGIGFTKHYHHKFTTGAVDGHSLSFYVLVDNGGLELFAGDYQYNFYNLTLAAPYSIGASLIVSGEVTINSLQVNEMKSVWKDLDNLDEGVLYLDSEDVALDMTLMDSKEIAAYSTNKSEINWEITSGNDVISLQKTIKGALVTALKAGDASIKVTSGDNVKNVAIHVDNSTVVAPFELKKENIFSGKWRIENSVLYGEQRSGDGYYVSDAEYDDVVYSVTFDLTDATAAGLLLRANKTMTNYIMVNYDKNAKQSKVWTPTRMIAEVGHDAGSNLVTITAKAKGNRVTVSVNGAQVSDVELLNSEPTTGYLGLNVFSGSVAFKQISVINENYEFENRDVVIDTGAPQYIRNVYNVTNRNELVARGFYSMSGSNLTIKKEYIQLLNENTTYEFFIEGELSTLNIKLRVNNITCTYSFDDQTINYGSEVTVYVGVLNVTSVKVDGETVNSNKYYVKDYVLHIDASLFVNEEVEVKINNQYSFTVYVENMPKERPVPSAGKGCGGNIVTTSAVLSALALMGVALISIKKRGRKDA